MVQNEENNDVYHNLTESIENRNAPSNGKWTLYLFLCCLTVCLSSFIFGYNIGATNLPTPIIKGFYTDRYFPGFRLEKTEFSKKNASFYNDYESFKNKKLELNETEFDSFRVKLSERYAEKPNKQELDEYLNTLKVDLDKKGDELNTHDKNVEKLNTFLWTITTSLFVAGGAIGAFGSKYILDYLGRKKGILFNNVFSTIGGILSIIAPMLNSPESIMVSRFFYGLNGGATCGLIPTYLAEVSPSNLRGATGVLHQLALTIGILVAQTLGFRQILGTAHCWHYLLAVPLIPSILGAAFLLLFFPESPKALLLSNKDEESARKALHRLRGHTNVSGEIEEMKQEQRESKSDESTTLKELFTLKELRWPLITGVVLQLTQQLCGINAIFFYSSGIFKRANIADEHIQYAVFATGFINVICTVLVVPLIDRLGRKPLLVYPMLVIIIDFIVLTVLLVFQDQYPTFAYLSIVCIVIFIMCFALGLGPIPFVYVAECFRQDARGAALAICMFTNWAANLLLTLTFEYLAAFLKNYVFLVFLAFVAVAVVVIFKKVPETKGRTVEEIMDYFEGRKISRKYDESSGKLMSNTSKV